MMHKKSWVAATVVALALGVAGCGGHGAGPASQGEPPVKLSNPDKAGVKTVTLSQEAADRLGIQIAKVGVYTPTANGARSELAVPYAAVVYDKAGATWTFVTEQPLTYLRKPVQVDHIDAETAYLANGPARGTAVVTTGSEELLGAEYQISGE
jgi:hypothetical protein